MTNLIRDVYVVNHRLDPHETELRVHVEVETLTPTTEIKGKLLGPRSAYASTVEIAYPLREVRRDDHIEMRVVIPEACWWEPKTPFLYQGAVELWQDGARSERIEICHGIRSLQLTSMGLRLNGKPFVLRGKLVQPEFSETQVASLRDAGMNCLLTARFDASLASWGITDQLGVFVLVEWMDYLESLLRDAKTLNQHASCVGCIGRAEWVDPTILKAIEPLLLGITSANLVPRHNAADAVPAGTAFLISKLDDLTTFNEIEIPKIVLTPQLPTPLPSRHDVIGWIESP